MFIFSLMTYNCSQMKKGRKECCVQRTEKLKPIHVSLLVGNTEGIKKHSQSTNRLSSSLCVVFWLRRPWMQKRHFSFRWHGFYALALPLRCWSNWFASCSVFDWRIFPFQLLFEGFVCIVRAPKQIKKLTLIESNGLLSQSLNWNGTGTGIKLASICNLRCTCNFTHTLVLNWFPSHSQLRSSYVWLSH